jgi:phosphinothricin acetyltransferase
LYLRPEFSGKGIGSDVLVFLEKFAIGNGIRVLIASISGENSASIKLFTRAGYEKCAHYREVGEKFGRILDVVDYQKILDA